MKKCVTKYLPIEGEIKEGDYYLWNNLQIHQYILNNEQRILGIKPDSTCKKVKLFLCSKDIQVGDKVYREKLGEWTVFEKDPDIHHKGGSWGLLEDVKNSDFKVIGEISPDAIWITERMEFDEDDINIRAWDGEDEWNFSVTEWLTEEQEHSYKFSKIEIKCPTCKQFH